MHRKLSRRTRVKIFARSLSVFGAYYCANNASRLALFRHYIHTEDPMASKQATRKAINLRGSTKLVTEFFKYAVNTSVFKFVTESGLTHFPL